MTLKSKIEALEKKTATLEQEQPIYLRRVLLGTDEFIWGVILDNGKTHYSRQGELEADFLERANVKNHLTEDFDKVRQQMLDDDDC